MSSAVPASQGPVLLDLVTVLYFVFAWGIFVFGGSVTMWTFSLNHDDQNEVGENYDIPITPF